MLTLALVAPTLTFHFFALVIVVLCACAIIFWLLAKVPIPEPFNYVLYAGLALIALWLLFGLLGGR